MVFGEVESCSASAARGFEYGKPTRVVLTGVISDLIYPALSQAKPSTMEEEKKDKRRKKATTRSRHAGTDAQDLDYS